MAASAWGSGGTSLWTDWRRDRRPLNSFDMRRRDDVSLGPPPSEEARDLNFSRLPSPEERRSCSLPSVLARDVAVELKPLFDAGRAAGAASVFAALSRAAETVIRGCWPVVDMVSSYNCEDGGLQPPIQSSIVHSNARPDVPSPSAASRRSGDR